MLKSFCLLIMIICSSKLSSQVLIGPKFGINNGILSVSNQVHGATNSFRSGVYAGVVIESRFNDVFSVQAEPSFNQKRSFITFPLPPAYFESDITFGYLQLPVLLKIRFENNSFSPYAVVGPNIGYLLNGRTLFKKDADPVVEIDLKAEYENTDAAIDVGLGVESTLLSDVIITAEVRYSYGVYNIQKDHSTHVTTNGILILVGALVTI